MNKLAYTIVKRTFDATGAIAVAAVAAPLVAGIAAGIKASSKGPVLFKSERIGKNGKPFTLYKFRSMHELKQPDGSTGKGEKGYLVNTNRIFPFGNFLRKSKLDELPQLINIVKGDMAVIGPRPLPASSAERNYVGRYADVLKVKPGLACLDSLYDYAHGELFVTDEQEYREKVLPMRNELAKMYVDNQSTWLDLYCIGRTVKLMFDIAVCKRQHFPYTHYEKIAEAKLLALANSEETEER